MCSKWPVDMLIITPNILSILGVCMKTGVELLTICFGWYKVVKKYLYVFKMTRWHVDNHHQYFVYISHMFENRRWTVDNSFLWVGVSEKRLYVFKITRWCVDNHPQNFVYLRCVCVKTGVDLLTIGFLGVEGSGEKYMYIQNDPLTYCWHSLPTFCLFKVWL